ncbi:Nucleotide-binding, alpha-beta plait, partial [Cynara cardunculus var. scolymus]
GLNSSTLPISIRFSPPRTLVDNHRLLSPPLTYAKSNLKMGMKAKKSMMKKAKKGSSQLTASVRKEEAADFLPLEGGPARKLPIIENSENKAAVLYIGRIPHGFYENEMEAFFKQFGEIKRIRIARNRKTGKSKHFGFLEFASPEVAKIVAETMHNYLLFEHLLQVQLVPPERVHPKLWKGVNRYYKPLDWVHIERKRQNKERTFEEHRKLVDGILKRDQRRRKKIEAAGIDYEYPEIVGSNEPAPKKIRFED